MEPGEGFEPPWSRSAGGRLNRSANPARTETRQSGGFNLYAVVGPPGLEPGITRTQTAYLTKLDHGPTRPKEKGEVVT